MLIQVNPHKIVLIKTNDVNSGEYNVNECTFEFSQEFDNLTCIAVFSLCDGTTKNITILNNRCIIPTEVLTQTGQVKIGVYGYSVQDDELVLRYSPAPQIFVVTEGSYKEGTEPVAPTPTDWEILVEQVSDNSRDISNIKEDITGINGEISGINIDIRDLQDTKANINDLSAVAFSGSYNDLINKPNLSVYATKTDLSDEATLRENADVSLQEQIDAISVSSDVVDVVGTYQELLNYDTQHLKDNDIVKVLVDSTHNDALSYYRWDKEPQTWSYIGSEGPFYTKAETRELLNAKEDKITTTNKLDADLVDDSNSTNKFVTEEDITYWDNKEDKSNKVTEINSSSTDTQYPSAKCVYDSQEEQNEHIAELEMLYNAFPTVSDEDTTIQLDNTAKVKFREIDLKGNTSQVVIPEEQGTSVSNTSIYVSDVDTDKEHTIEMSGNTYQYTTTGKNLINFASPEQVSSAITSWSFANDILTISGDGTRQTLRWTITDIYKNGAGKSIKLVCSSLDTSAYVSTTQYIAQMSVYYTDETSTQYLQMLDTSNTSIERAIPSDVSNIDYVYLSLYSNNTSTSSVSTIKFVKPMLIFTTSSETPYEPYTYGASPNPDYPQNIEVVTGTQNVEVCGKNLFDKSKAVLGKRLDPTGYYYNDANYYTSPYIRVTPNIKYIKNSPSQDAYHRYCFYTKDKVFINQSTYNVYTIPSNCWYVRFCGLQSELDTTQFEQGDTSTTYEAYTGTTYSVNLGNIELCKIDTYKDRIYKSNDKWYLEKNIQKITVNGSEENWSLVSTYTNTLRFQNTSLLTNRLAQSGIKIKCNKFIVLDNNDNSDVEHVRNAASTYPEFFFAFIDKTRLSDNTVNAFKIWLSSNNLLVYYILNTPTTTEITDTTLVNQLNALYNATIYPITNINTDTSNLLPYIDLHYNFVTPSPSPSRPSVVNVVKGENTLTISNSDNTESQSYPINLGDIELCKIGTYQDYIYESNGNWFKKGNIGKTTLNGTEDWTLTNNVLQSTNEMPSDIRAIGATMSAYSSHFEYHYYATSITTNIQNGEFGWNSGKKLTFKIDGFTTQQEYTNWLGNNNVSIYYQLATPTDTQITDTTLITQLNNIKKAYSYDTQTNISQTNTDKPFIIYAEAIRSLKDVFE